MTLWRGSQRGAASGRAEAAARAAAIPPDTPGNTGKKHALMRSGTIQSGEALPANCRLFILFRVLFNARFYYPVLGVLFLDLGLTLGQYALLNTVWAFVIVLLEVPSGALADHFGRKRMVAAAGALMVAEMALFAFAPAGHPGLLFVCLLANRILSGMAEAFASGADEALAFDSLDERGRAAEWPRVLDLLGRFSSGAFFVAMILGAALYDPAWVSALLGFLGIRAELAAEQTMRLPVYLTLLTALGAMTAAFLMRETRAAERGLRAPRGARGPGVALRRTLVAGRWILARRFALLLLLAGLVIDSSIRLILTINSNFYRLAGIPEGWFGLLGAGFALLGLVAASAARGLVARFGARENFAMLAALTLAGLAGVAVARSPWQAVAAVVPLGLAFQMLGFFMSHYLNAAADPAHRATILSFRGLAFNLGYGGAGLLFAGLTAAVARARNLDGGSGEVLDLALPWLPVWFAAACSGVLAARAALRRPGAAR